MGTEHSIRAAQTSRNAYGDRFLAHAEMDRTADDAILPGPCELLLDQANAYHLAELAPEELRIFGRNFDRFVIFRRVGEVAEIKHRHKGWDSLGQKKLPLWPNP
jgi:hypothetical protein